ncbi:MAG: site-2 protease family protein [Patescibacteria group bacterium]|nr:site-2 protease family protein [Patescibacteria group bacterium]
MSQIFIQLATILVAITIHEFAHAWAAYKLGDSTAKTAGRLSLNPLKHLDPIGAVLFLFTGFGWAKPVPLNPSNFEDPQKDSALTALAGPSSNLLLAIAAAMLLRVTPLPYFIGIMLIALNVQFAIFNLVPMPPLDGFNFVNGLLPRSFIPYWQELRKYQLILLLLLFIPLGNQSIVSLLVGRPADLLINLLLP